MRLRLFLQVEEGERSTQTRCLKCNIVNKKVESLIGLSDCRSRNRDGTRGRTPATPRTRPGWDDPADSDSPCSELPVWAGH